MRDYVHVEDLAAAHVKALALLGRRPGCHAFNLGTGVAVSVREILDAIERVSGKVVKTTTAPRRSGDPMALYAAVAKAQHELGWSAVHSDIDTTVGSALKWYRRRLERRRDPVGAAGE